MATREGSSCRDYFVSGIAVAVLVILTIIVRLERDSARYLRAGDEAYRQGRIADALFQWKMSVEMYVPFSPTPKEAANRLVAAAERFRSAGDAEMAARAFGYLRSGLLSTRHLRQPMPELLARAEVGLGPPGAASPERGSIGKSRRGGSGTAGTVLLCIGFVGWPVSVFRAIAAWRGSGKMFTPRTVVPGAISLAMVAAGAILA